MDFLRSRLAIPAEKIAIAGTVCKNVVIRKKLNACKLTEPLAGYDVVTLRII